MKIFISWSGERSRLLAEVLRDWIPLVLQYVEPWLSEVDIAAGERWADAVARELEASNFGIICVTRENVASPWVLFEAGALAKLRKGSRVIPLLLDLEFRELGGPLTQFKAKKVDRADMAEVIHSINRASAQPVTEGRIKRLLDLLWPEFERHLGGQPAAGTHPSLAATPTTRLRADSVLGELGGEGDDLPALVESATRVSVLARTAVNLFNYHGALVRDLAQKGCDVRLLLVAQDVAEVYKFDTQDRFLRNLESTDCHVRDLPSSVRRRIKVRFTRHVPTMSLFVIEKGEPQKNLVRVQPYFLQSCSGAERPIFTVSGAKRWYRIFSKEFDILWRTGRRDGAPRRRLALQVKS